MNFWQQLFAERAGRMKASDIREAFKLAERGDIISFAGGFPAPETFPREEVGAIAAEIVTTMAATSLQYGPTEGLYELRDLVARRLTAKGVPCQPEDVLLTTGSQQALDLIAKVVIDPGDAVVVEKPGYIGGISAFGNYEASFVGVPLDDDGLCTDQLEEALRSAQSPAHGRNGRSARIFRNGQTDTWAPRVKLCYVVPNFQNPSGVTLSEERRRHLVQLAARYGLAVVEDDPYGEIRFEGSPPPAIKSFDFDGRVLYLGSFSKIAFPGLRVGFVVGHRDLMQKLSVAKQGTDLCSSSFGQKLLAECLKRGVVDAHLEAIIPVYKRKRDLMLEALSRYFPEEARWTYPEGGFFVWVTLPEGMDAKEMLPEAVTCHRVAYVSGGAFFTDGTGKNTIRLAYSQASDDSIVEGVRRLGGFLKEKITRRRLLSPAGPVEAGKQASTLVPAAGDGGAESKR